MKLMEALAVARRPLPENASLFEIVNEYERRTIIERLEKCSWSQTEAAESLHVPLSTNFIFVISPATESAWKVIFRNLWWPFFWEVVPL